jgi:hypothetical protein
MQSPFVNVLIGVLGSYLYLVESDAYIFYFRMGFARLAEDSIRRIRGKSETDKLGPLDKILASSIGGALATWNQPIEVIRVEVNFCSVHRYSFVTFSILHHRCKAWLKRRKTRTGLPSSLSSTR